MWSLTLSLISEAGVNAGAAKKILRMIVWFVWQSVTVQPMPARRRREKVGCGLWWRTWYKYSLFHPLVLGLLDSVATLSSPLVLVITLSRRLQSFDTLFYGKDALQDSTRNGPGGLTVT
jgi:hypothetical protein